MACSLLSAALFSLEDGLASDGVSATNEEQQVEGSWVPQLSILAPMHL